MSHKLKEGDRITLKVPAINGWKGSGTVTWTDNDLVMFRRDGSTGVLADRCFAARHEVRRHRQ